MSDDIDKTPLDDPAWVVRVVEERDALRNEVLFLRARIKQLTSVGPESTG